MSPRHKRIRIQPWASRPLGAQPTNLQLHPSKYNRAPIQYLLYTSFVEAAVSPSFTIPAHTLSSKNPERQRPACPSMQHISGVIHDTCCIVVSIIRERETTHTSNQHISQRSVYRQHVPYNHRSCHLTQASARCGVSIVDTIGRLRHLHRYASFPFIRTCSCGNREPGWQPRYHCQLVFSNGSEKTSSTRYHVDPSDPPVFHEDMTRPRECI